MSRKPSILLIVLLVTALTGCAPVAAPPSRAMPAAATPAPMTPTPVNPSKPVEYGPYGQVLWNDAPVAGARVKLAKQGACRDAGQDAVLAETVANAGGQFAFPSIPAVEWDVCYAWPAGQGDDAWMIGERQPVMPVENLTLPLYKTLRLLAPDLSQPQEGPLEMSWEGVDEVSIYRVAVSDMGTSELLFLQDVTGTSATVPQPLSPGHGYGIGVHGLNAAGEQIAVFMGELMAGGVAVSPQEEPVQPVPATCSREGLLTYVSREMGICFAYPQGFAFEGAQGPYAAGSQAQAELRGPAIGANAEPAFARLSFDFQPYNGVDLPQFVDEMIKRDVPASLATGLKREQATWGGRAAEVLEPWPGQLSSRVVVVDAAPVGFNILTFWPSPAGAPAGQAGADVLQAQKDMEALYEIVSASFARLPPPGVPVDPVQAGSEPGSASALVQSEPYQGVSLSFSAAVAASATGRTAPVEGSSDGPWWKVSPQHIVIAFEGYVHDVSVHTPHVAVYEAEEFAALSPQAAQQIAALRKLLEAKPAEPEGPLPFLPHFNAVQQIRTRVKYLPFRSGEGVSYLTQLSQGIVPVNNEELFYTFQGLTNDGKYYVSATLPVSNAALPATAADVPAAQLAAMTAGWTGYLKDVTGTLDSGQDAGFQPALSDLDALVGSIEVAPDGAAAAAVQVGMSRLPDVNPNYTVQQIPALPLADDVPPFDAHPPFALVRFPDYGGGPGAGGPGAGGLDDGGLDDGGEEAGEPYLFGQPAVHVYRVADLQAFRPSEGESTYRGQYEALKQLLDSAAPLAACGGVSVKPGQNITPPVLPLLPLTNSTQAFCTKPATVDFPGGKGIRYVTAFSQAVTGLSDASVFYTFQGLTDDGQYYVSAILPVATGVLPAGGGEGMDPKTWTATLEGWAAQLGALEESAFRPSLESLDRVVGSIEVR